MKTSDFYRVAKKELDITEVAGNISNPQIIKFLQSTTLSNTLNSSDETPWCSAFVNWCVEQAGVEGTNRADAVSWLTWGIKADKPVRGTIVIFQWSNGGHHVGFVSAFDQPGKVSVLGGNQSNEVKISQYDEKFVIGYRNPEKNFFSAWIKILAVGIVGVGAILGTIFLISKLGKH